MEIFLAVVVLGLLPAFIAHSRGHNFVLWWMLGAALFPLALIAAFFLKRDLAHSKRKCPHCAETIRAEATTCRFCGRDVQSLADPPGKAEMRDLRERLRS
jgi:hypothetical protein